MSTCTHFLCGFLVAFFSLSAAEADPRKELSTIQQEINQTEQKIHQLRLKAIGAELKGDESMRTEWDRYVEQIEKSENYDVEVMKLEKELQKLQNKKRELLIQYKSLLHEKP